MTPRRPGQHARQTTNRLASRWLVAIAVLTVLPLLVGLAAGFRSTVLIVAQLVVLAALWAIDRWAVPVVERRARGARGEEKVGEVIATLEADGWLALHDVELGRGNTDHILIGPAGVLTVETKSHPGRIHASRVDQRMLKQSYAQAKQLERITGENVAPLLVFSRAFLIPMVSRQRGVVVLPARALRGHLARRPAVLEPAAVRALHARLLHALEAPLAA